MPALEEGQRLGSYVVGGLLGRGGMAEVYRATHVTLERPVAIKVLSPMLNTDPTFPLRFLREAKTVARLNHPNIVTVYDFGEEGELAYLVMELASGGTLRERARQYGTLAEAVDGLAPVGLALQYAHEHGVAHRDIKPINVLIGDQEQPLLADFGLARVASESLDLTLTGVSFGSPHYIAPEQALAGNADHRADIYSFGIVVYEVLAGRLPYTGQTPFAVIQQHLTAPPPSIKAVLPDVPDTLERAIQRATAKRPEDRLGSVSELVAELRRAAEEAPLLSVGTGRTVERGPTIRPSTGPVMGPGEQSAADQATTETSALPLGNAEPTTATGAAEVARLIEDVPTPSGLSADVTVPLGQRDSGTASAANGDGASDQAAVLDGPAEPLKPALRRPTSFNGPQRAFIAALVAVVVFINAAGLWLATAGRGAAAGQIGESIVTGIYDHLSVFKSVLTASAFGLALIAMLAMRTALVDDHHLTIETYRRLRQYHRMVGYSAMAISLTIGLLTCFGIFGFGTSTLQSTVHSVLGMALLAVAVVKVAVVRYFPSRRRHLKLIGESLVVLLFLVLATSTVPAIWSHVTHSGLPSPYKSSITQGPSGPSDYP